MRTTFTLEDDLARVLDSRARQLGISFEEMVHRTLRTGLGSELLGAGGNPPKTIPHSYGFRPGVDLDRLNELGDELEVDARAASLEEQAK